MPDEITIKKDARAQERARYIEAALTTQVGLESSVRLLKTRETLSADIDELRDARFGRLDFEGDIAKVQARLIGFLADSFSFKPPTVDDVNWISVTFCGDGSSTCSHMPACCGMPVVQPRKLRAPAASPI